MDENKTLIIIEMIGDEKYIHYSGYAYYAGNPQDKPYRWIDYTFLMCPLSKAIDYGIKEYESDYQDDVQQYISDLTEFEYDEIVNDEKHIILNAEDITQDIACGTYWV